MSSRPVEPDGSRSAKTLSSWRPHATRCDATLTYNQTWRIQSTRCIYPWFKPSRSYAEKYINLQLYSPMGGVDYFSGCKKLNAVACKQKWHQWFEIFTSVNAVCVYRLCDQIVLSISANFSETWCYNWKNGLTLVVIHSRIRILEHLSTSLAIAE